MKTFPLKIDDELHKLIKHASIEENTSVHSWIIGAITSKLHQNQNIIREKMSYYGGTIKKSKHSIKKNNEI